MAGKAQYGKFVILAGPPTDEVMNQLREILTEQFREMCGDGELVMRDVSEYNEVPMVAAKWICK